MGDAIQFARYVPRVAAMGARVVLQVHAPLVPLFTQLPAERVVAFEERLPPFDTYCALMSLPLAFGTTLESIPREVPYLRAPRERVERWQALLGESAHPRVGLAWSGNPAQANDLNRSMPAAHLAPLKGLGASIFNLQKEVRESDRAALAQAGIRDPGAPVADFADTAAIVELMDVVVSVDTSVAHLAGAMGKPLIAMLCHNADWRWLTQRTDSPWYPTARLVRQRKPGDWAGVVDEVVRELSR
jgi:hypothetical protein